jgi:DNA-binding transcriptional LysR family regulator
MLTAADRDISLEDLEAVLAVVECGQFSRAGEILRRTQPAVSRSVQNIEKSVQTKLLDRGARPTAPTQAGEDFTYEVRRGLFFIARGLRRARSMGRRESSSLEIGYSTFLDPEVLTYLTNISRTASSGFSAVYHSSCTAEIIAKVQAGIWDCGFVVSPASIFDLDNLLIFEDSLCVVMGTGHPLARKKNVALADLVREPLILPARDRNAEFHFWFVDRCERAGAAPEIVQEVSHPHEGILLAARNLGVAVTTKSASRTVRKGSTVLRGIRDEGMAVEIRFVMRREPQSQALQALTQIVRKLTARISSSSTPKAPASIPSSQRSSVA